MRLPNGYGSVAKLSGTRRRPWVVRITAGWTDDGKNIRKVLGYYPSRTAALEALTSYRANPYDLSAAQTTFNDLWKKWTAITYTDRGEAIPHAYTAAYKRLPNLHEMNFADIRRRHIQGEIDSCPLGFSTKRFENWELAVFGARPPFCYQQATSKCSLLAFIIQFMV